MNVRKVIEEYPYYDGVAAPMKLSASQISRDVLELYLAATEDSESGAFGKGNIGSIFHIGMEEMFKTQPRVIEGEAMQKIRRSRELPNGWIIDGKVDMLDFIDMIITDWKGLSASAYNTFKKNDRDHRINMQMAVYNWLFGGDFGCEAHCFITNWDPCNETHPATAYQIMKCEIYEPEEIEEIMMNKTAELSRYLASKKVPPKCKELMPRRLKSGSFINSKCEFYCNYAHVCSRKRDDTAKKLGLDWTRK